MSLPTLTFNQYTQSLVTAWAAALNLTPNLTSGDPLLAIMQSVATQLVWLQSLVEIVNQLARASTSTGADLDTWMADFGFFRLPATEATGSVIFSTIYPAVAPIYISLGTVVQTNGGATQYQVVADSTQTAYSSGASAYVINTASSSATATVQALVAGSAQNVSINQLTQLGSPIPGISTVTNPLGISNGIDQESDASFRARFILYINSLSKATSGAIAAAILGVQQGLSYSLVENQTTSGAPDPGYFYAFVDDGSGNTPAATVTEIQNAVNLVRAFTVQENVFAATKASPNIVFNLRVVTGSVTGAIQNSAAAAVMNYVNSLTIGATIYLNKMIEVIIDSSPMIISVQPGTATIGGSANDYVLTNSQVPKIALSNITVGVY